MAAMSGSPLFGLSDQSARSDSRENPYLGVYSINVFVRDQDRSLRFYVDQLGFNLAFDVRLQSGQRWVGVAPPHGTAVLTLMAPEPDSDDYKLIGQPTPVSFVSEDVIATYTLVESSRSSLSTCAASEARQVRKTRGRRVPKRRLGQSSLAACWASRPRSGAELFTRFEDIDKNSFALVSFDEMTQAVEAQRRAAAEKLRNPNAAPLTNWKSRNRCRPGSSPRSFLL